LSAIEVLPRHTVSIHDLLDRRENPISRHLRHRLVQTSSHQRLAPPAADPAEDTGQ